MGLAKALIEKMSLYVLYCAGPDHRQPAQCDSDRTDVRDIMVKAAVLTGNGVFRFCGYEALDLESCGFLDERERSGMKQLYPGSRSA